MDMTIKNKLTNSLDELSQIDISTLNDKDKVDYLANMLLLIMPFTDSIEHYPIIKATLLQLGYNEEIKGIVAHQRRLITAGIYYFLAGLFGTFIALYLIKR